MKKRLFLTAASIIMVSIAFAGVVRMNTKHNNSDEKVRIKKFNFAMQCWTFRQFTFLETLEKVEELGIKYLEAFPGQKFSKDKPDAKFHHTMDDELISIAKEKLKEHGIRLVNYGVVGFKNDEESMREVYDFAKKMRIQTIVTEPGFDDFSLIEKMVKEYRINIAIHNHPAPTKYAKPEVVIDHVKGLDQRIGGCCDTGHWMRTGVDPVKALKMFRGRIISLHLKDLNIFGDKEKAFDVPFGSGAGKIKEILEELTKQDFQGYISIEHENKDEVNNPSPSVKKGLEFVKSVTYYEEYEQILKRNWGSYNKSGWNHYGPGYFELDEKTGVLKSHKGMGLLWYSQKKYKDFVLEFDYKCDHLITNSGVFVRIPDIPVSDNYIYHSFEIQINDAGKGIHKTAAVYDAKAPETDAFYEPGQWNHMKITLHGGRYIVEVNDIKVNDWLAEPKGKVRDIADEGYFGFQNHDHNSAVYFKKIYIREL